MNGFTMNFGPATQNLRMYRMHEGYYKPIALGFNTQYTISVSEIVHRTMCDMANETADYVKLMDHVSKLKEGADKDEMINLIDSIHNMARSYIERSCSFECEDYANRVASKDLFKEKLSDRSKSTDDDDEYYD